MKRTLDSGCHMARAEYQLPLIFFFGVTIIVAGDAALLFSQMADTCL